MLVICLSANNFWIGKIQAVLALSRWESGINYSVIKVDFFKKKLFYRNAVRRKTNTLPYCFHGESFCLDDSITEALLFLCQSGRVSSFTKTCLCSLPRSFASSSEKAQLQMVVLYLDDCVIKLAGT